MAEGDLITYLNVNRAWEDEGRSPEWCQKNYVSHRALLRASDIRRSVQSSIGILCIAFILVLLLIPHAVDMPTLRSPSTPLQYDYINGW